MTAIERLPPKGEARQNPVLRYLGGAGLSADFIKYALSSVLALALDFTVLVICHRLLGFNHLAAAAAGFLSGLALIYALSIGIVFRDRRSVSAGVEVVGFLLSGCAGLALTEALMHFFVDRFGLTPPLSKIPTSGLVFLFNFTARREFLFSRDGK